MQSTGRPNFWIPPESTYETAVPSPTSASRLSPEPATPTRFNTRFNRPPLPLPSPQKQSQRPPNIAPPVHSPSPQPVRHNDRTGKEYNRRERRFENIFNQWSQEVARLQEEHRTVSLKCRNEEETTLAMDNFNRKVQIVMTKYNEEIEALQMSSSEPPSSQSENEEEEDSPAPTPARSHSFQFHQNDGSNEEEEEDEEDEEEDDDSGEDDDDDEEDLVPGGVDPPEHALDDDDDEEEDEDDEDRASTPLSEALAVDMSSGDDTDHSARLSRRSVKSYQSSEVSQGSQNLNTPPPTEIDEDHRATRRRQARERRKTDELASALPQRLRSETLRGTSPLSVAAAPRPAAMSLFENLSSSPASMSSMHSSQQASSPYGSRRPSRDVPTARPSPIEVNPAALASRIDYLRRQNSTSGSDRSLSRNRQQSSPADERSLFKDQFESWKSSIQNQSEAVLKKVEKQTEDVKHKFKLEQEEKHQRAQQIFIAEQERLLQSFNRNRAGSTGSTAASASLTVGSHPRSGSFAIPQSHAIGPSVSPTLQRAVPSPAPQSNSPAGRPLHASVSQTFQYASAVSQSPPQSSPSRTWVPRNTPMSTQPGNRLSTASSSESDEVDGPLEDDESDAQPTYKGTPPISIPNSARGSFDMGHRRTGSQVYSGTSGASSTPRNPFPQHLRNSSSTTFSSNGTASARSSGGWSGVSGTSTNTTVTSSDTPGSRRGSVGEKTFVAPNGLHGESRKNPNGLVVGTSPPSGPRRTAMVGSMDAPGSATHSPASTLSRASAAAMNPNSSVNIPPRTTAQQWRTDASASSPSAASAVPPISNPSISVVGSLPRPSIGSLNLAQSPGKSSWKATATGKPSPPIPIQTRPSGSNSQRQWSETPSVSNASPPFPLGSVSRDSPTLRSSMSNVDLVSASGSRNVVKLRQSTSAFNAAPTRKDSIGRGSRSKSPSKSVAIPARSSPSKVSSTQPSANLSDVTQSSPEQEVTLPKREQKKAETSKRAKNKEEADRRKREEDLLRREEEIKRREEEIKREQREEKKRREKEAERKREEDLLRREAELREREEKLKRQEAEIAEARRKREAEEAEAEAKRQKEAEAIAKRQREEAEEAKRREEEEERPARNSFDEQNRRASQPSKKKGKKAAAKRSAEEQRELEAAKERERIAEEERLAEEARLEEERLERLEDERLEEQARLEDERRKEEARIEAARVDAARLEAEQRKEAKRRDQEARRQEARLSADRREEARLAERQKQERADARLAAEIREQERQEEERRRREQERLEARRTAEKREQEKLEEERLEQARQQRKAELYRQEQEALKKLAEERERRMHSLRHDDDRRQAWTRQQEQQEEELEKRLEEERRAQEARIREENNRMTEMFQARDRSNQMNTNMPKRFADAWEAYDEKWKKLVSQAQTGGRPLTFATVPWPLLTPPSGPEAITRVAVGNFILSQWHSKGKSPRDRIRDALLRWHPDRFESRYLGLAPEGDERENVRIGVGNVTRSLNELLTKEGPSAPL